MDSSQARYVLGELERLAEAAGVGDFKTPLSSDPPRGREESAEHAGEASLASRMLDALQRYQSTVHERLQRHALINRALGIACWDMEVRNSDPLDPGNHFVWSPELRHMLGFSDERDFPDVLASWSSRLHPEDKATVLNAFAAHIADRTGGTPYSQDCRLKLKNGDYRYFRVVGTTRRDASGEPLRVIGALRDVNERKVAEQALHEIEERMTLMLRFLPLAVMMWDRDLRILDCARRAVTLLGFAGKQDLIDRFMLFAPEYQPDGSPSRDMLAEAIRVAFEKGRHHCEYTHRTVGGEPIVFDIPLIRMKYKDDFVVVAYARDIGEEKKMRADIIMAREQAEEANEAKSIFLATMSHEMRTPLNAVIGLAELTLDQGGLSEAAESNLEHIYNSGSTLLSIVNDILDISKVKSGKFEIFANEYDVSSMVNDAVTQNILRIGNNPIQFKLEIDPEMPSRLYGDDLRTKQIISNLLSNAFKYTEQGSVTLSLRCEREDGAIRLIVSVTDTGIGIRPEYLPHLFSDYTQFDAQAHRKVGGTGLGLSITKSLAELMGGSIAVESEYGKGSVFTVTLRQQTVTDKTIGADMAANLSNFRYSTSKRDRNARLKRIRLPYARVLVVDDHPVNLDVAKGLMKPYGMHIDCVGGGQQAIDLIREQKVRYDAVFMDHMMPGMDGVEAVRRIRQIGGEYAAGLPIIALTANAIAGNEEMFLAKGFQAFIAKPVDMLRLDEVLRQFVRDEAREAELGSERLERRGGRDRRVASRRNRADLRALMRRNEGLDMDSGIKRFGDMESFTRVLRSYTIHTKGVLESLRSVEPEGLVGWAITVHGLKGASRGICAEAAGDAAEALEQAAKRGDLDFVREHSPAFLELVGKLVRDIEAMLDSMPQPVRPPRKDRPDSGLLSQLYSACDSYDMDGVDAAVAAIAAFDYEAEPGFADWLRENVTLLNFTQIKDRIIRMPHFSGSSHACAIRPEDARHA